MTVSLVGFEQHKAQPDLADASGFWLCVTAGHVFPFTAAFNASPGAFHEFLIEQRAGMKTRSSIFSAQIINIEEVPKPRVLIRPHGSVEEALISIARECSPGCYGIVEPLIPRVSASKSEIQSFLPREQTRAECKSDSAPP
jgi:hypothetical protein